MNHTTSNNNNNNHHNNIASNAAALAMSIGIGNALDWKNAAVTSSMMMFLLVGFVWSAMIRSKNHNGNTTATATATDLSPNKRNNNSTSSESNSNNNEDGVGSKDMFLNGVSFHLPEWLLQDNFKLWNEFKSQCYKTDEERMALAIEVSRLNVIHQTGGPFGCVIFRKTQIKEFGGRGGDAAGYKYELVSVGMNRVVPLNNSTLHGEMVAIQLAQQMVKRFTLNKTSSSDDSYELYTSCEPCCMCLGASLWSGVSRVVCAATKADASAIGFDEGPVFEESYEHLKKAGIDVRRRLLREEAAAVLQMYSQQGLIYNR